MLIWHGSGPASPPAVFPGGLLGRTAILAVGIQSAKGVAATPTEMFGLSGGSLPGPDKTAGADDRSSLSQPMSLSAYVSGIRVTGSPEAFVRPSMLGLLLYAILGDKEVAGAGDPWTHTFSIAGTQPWLTFYRSQADVVFERFVDCKLSWLRIVSRAGQPLRVSFGIVGITPRYQTAPPAGTPEAGSPFLHYDGQGALEVEGIAIAQIDDFDLLLNRGTVSLNRLSGPAVRTGPRMTVTARVGQVLTDFGLWNRMHYGSASPANDTPGYFSPLELGDSPAALSFKFLRQASPERSLQIDLPRLHVERIEGPGDITGVVRQVVTYGALRPMASQWTSDGWVSDGWVSGSSAHPGITATLVNARAAY